LVYIAIFPVKASQAKFNQVKASQILLRNKTMHHLERPPGRSGPRTMSRSAWSACGSPPLSENIAIPILDGGQGTTAERDRLTRPTGFCSLTRIARIPQSRDEFLIGEDSRNSRNSVFALRLACPGGLALKPGVNEILLKLS
jgi:hypothetical protein